MPSGSVTITTADGDRRAVRRRTRRPASSSATRLNLVGGICDPFTGCLERGQLARLDDRLRPLLPVPLPRLGQRRQRGRLHVRQRRQGLDQRTGRARASRSPRRRGAPTSTSSGTTLFYGPSGGNTGTFTVTADVDRLRRSGIDKVTFPSLSGMTGGGDDTTSPYQSSLRLDRGQSASGAQTVTVAQQRRPDEPASFTRHSRRGAADRPGRGSSAAGYYTSLSVPVTLQDGTDALSGVDPASADRRARVGDALERSVSPGRGTWIAGHASPAAPTPRSHSNNCYHYRYVDLRQRRQPVPRIADEPGAKVDATTPVTSDDAPGGWQNSAVTVKLSVNETGSGVASTVYRVDGGAFQSGTSVSIPAPAEPLERRRAHDRVPLDRQRGQRRDAPLGDSAYRHDAPDDDRRRACRLEHVAGHSHADPADALSGIASTQYRVDGGSFQGGTSVSIPAPADHSNDGAHTIEYRSTDNAGNVEPLQTATVRIDTTAADRRTDGARRRGARQRRRSRSRPRRATCLRASPRSSSSSGRTAPARFTAISTDTTAPYDGSWDSTERGRGQCRAEGRRRRQRRPRR